jgi:hypothetical protein
MFDLIFSLYGLLNLVIALTCYALGIGLIFPLAQRSGTPLSPYRKAVLVLVVGPCLLATVLVILCSFSAVFLLALEDFGVGTALERLGLDWAIDVIGYAVLFSPGVFAAASVTGILRFVGLFR